MQQNRVEGKIENNPDLFGKEVLEGLLSQIKRNPTRNAFCIEGQFYSYQYLGEVISSIRKVLKGLNPENKLIGLVTNNDLETYASIWALWLEGKSYVPLSKKTPLERNYHIINKVGIDSILDSSIEPVFYTYHTIATKGLHDGAVDWNISEISDQELAYVLFTSGSTGSPKAIPINRSNLRAFIIAFDKLGYKLDENDRWLQMFELTFDLSIMCYVFPLIHGACVYTLPEGGSKFASVAEIIEEQRITISLMVPSVLRYLRSYFDEIECPEMKYSFFCGEPLPEEIIKAWKNVVPQAKIINLYGPTENTIICTHYDCTPNPDKKSKTDHGICSIGKALEGNDMIVIDKNRTELAKGEIGELCIAGAQLTKYYLANEDKNKESFFTMMFKGKETRFYRTGDLVFLDDEEDWYYVGRKDAQIKIQGYRVELHEVEFNVNQIIGNKHLAVLGFTNAIGNTELALFIESDPFEVSSLLADLKNRVPDYMIPSQVRFVSNLPLNGNGKTDKKTLAELLKKSMG